MRRLNVDLDALAEAMDGDTRGVTWYLDAESGALLVVRDEVREELEAIYEDVYGDVSAKRIPFADALRQRLVPEGMREPLIEADRVAQDDGSRFVPVPATDSRVAYQDLEAFIATVEDGELQAWLGRAIIGRGAFRRFKDTLAEAPPEHERWLAFRDARLRERALAWLRQVGIEAVEG
jgi:hypothetical protein